MRNREEFDVSKLVELRVGLIMLAWSESSENWRETHGQQESMLIYDVKSVELPEIVPKATTFVWLDTVENISTRLPHALDISIRQATVISGAIPNWEVSVLYGSFSSGSHNSMSQMVERTTKIVEGVTKNKPNIHWNDRNTLDEISDITGLFVGLLSDTVTVGISEALNSSFEILDMLLAPLVFC